MKSLIKSGEFNKRQSLIWLEVGFGKRWPRKFCSGNISRTFNTNATKHDYHNIFIVQAIALDKHKLAQNVP